jgi:hypothetical protein
MVSLMATPGFIAVYEFTYRGQPEEWSQGYHVSADYDDAADFNAAMDDFRVYTADVLSAATYFSRFLGYHDLSPGHSHDFVHDIRSSNLTGAMSTSGLTPCPGDDAVWVRWKMGHLSSRGKPVYLRKYFHDCYVDEDGDPDAIASAYQSALGIWGTQMYNDTGNGHPIADKDGTRPSSTLDVSTWITTRTLERRGKRPTP